MSANQPSKQNSLRSILARIATGHAARLAILFAASVTVGGSLHAQVNLGVNPQSANPNTREMNPYVVQGAGVTDLNQGTPVPGGAGGSVTFPGATMGVGSQTVGSPTGISYPDPTQYVLSAGDLIRVTLFGVTDYFATVRISKDGTVQLPLIGSLNLSGITIRQASDLIATALKSGGMFRSPEVMIGIAEAASPSYISFAGEKSGIFPMQGQRTLLDVIANTGGLPNTAGHVVSILRPGVEAPITVNLGDTAQDLLKANIPVFPRDTIFIQRAGAIYMLGAFKTPGAYTLPRSGLTLMQAAALAGGVTYPGKFADMRIVRTVGAERQEVKVDIKRIQFGLDPDPILQSSDILFLPTQPVKQIIASGGVQTLLGVIGIVVLALFHN